jgi:hypothetical protein
MYTLYSAASSAWMPAWIFSHTRGTPKNAVGWAAPTVASSRVDAFGQKNTCHPLVMARYSVYIRSAMCAIGR